MADRCYHFLHHICESVLNDKGAKAMLAAIIAAMQASRYYHILRRVLKPSQPPHELVSLQ